MSCDKGRESRRGNEMSAITFSFKDMLAQAMLDKGGDMALFLWIPTVENLAVVEFCVGKNCSHRQREVVKCVGEVGGKIKLYLVCLFIKFVHERFLKCFTGTLLEISG